MVDQNCTALIAVLCALALGCASAGASPHGADCMKNPFASGCRGISAKRSNAPALVWPAQLEPADVYRAFGAAPTQQHQQATRPSGANELLLQRLASAAELLAEASGSLLTPEQLRCQRRFGAAGLRLCRELGEGAELLASQKREEVERRERADK